MFLKRVTTMIEDADIALGAYAIDKDSLLEWRWAASVVFHK
jgi:hypothetical protein